MSSQPTWVPRKRRGAEFFLGALLVAGGMAGSRPGSPGGGAHELRLPVR